MTRSTLDDSLITVDMHDMATTIQTTMRLLAQFCDTARQHGWAWEDPSLHVDYDGHICMGWYGIPERRLSISVHKDSCAIFGLVTKHAGVLEAPSFVQLANPEENILLPDLDLARAGAWYFGGEYAPRQ